MKSDVMFIDYFKDLEVQMDRFNEKQVFLFSICCIERSWPSVVKYCKSNKIQNNLQSYRYVIDRIWDSLAAPSDLVYPDEFYVPEEENFEIREDSDWVIERKKIISFFLIEKKVEFLENLDDEWVNNSITAFIWCFMRIVYSFASSYLVIDWEHARKIPFKVLDLIFDYFPADPLKKGDIEEDFLLLYKEPIFQNEFRVQKIFLEEVRKINYPNFPEKIYKLKEFCCNFDTFEFLFSTTKE